MTEDPSSYPALLRLAEERLIPLAVTLELTERCSFRCVHCFYPDHQRPDGLDTPRLLELLGELAEMGTLFLTFTGGEVLLRRDWLELARRARALGFRLTLLTNAAHVDDAAADAVAALPAAVEASLYGLDARVFEGVTGVPGSLARTLAGIERLARRGVQLRLKCPVMAVNLDQLPGLAEYARSIGAELQTDPRLLHRTDGDSGPTALRVAPAALVEYFRAPWSSVPVTSVGAAPLPLDEPPCAAGTRVATVTAQGDVLACGLLRVSAGNLRDRSFRDIWLGSEWLERLRRVRRRDLRECSGCSRLAYCHRCPAQALAEDHDLLGPCRWSCVQAAALEEAHGRAR